MLVLRAPRRVWRGHPWATVAIAAAPRCTRIRGRVRCARQGGCREPREQLRRRDNAPDDRRLPSHCRRGGCGGSSASSSSRWCQRSAAGRQGRGGSCCCSNGRSDRRSVLAHIHAFVALDCSLRASAAVCGCGLRLSHGTATTAILARHGGRLGGSPRRLCRCPLRLACGPSWLGPLQG